jgi:pimeloyl-ACP methyl ester carboxylesterase
MTRRFATRICTVAASIVVLAPLAAGAHADAPPALRPGSGINASDTYFTADVTVQDQATLTLAQAVHDTATNADTTSLPVGDADTHYHVEAGYDTANHFVFNLYPSDPAADPTTTLTDSISRVQYVNGQATAYDLDGSPLPTALPTDPQHPSAGSSAPQPSAWLGLMPGPSVLDYVVTANPGGVAAQTGGTYAASTVGGQPVGQVTIPNHAAGGGTTVWSYASGPSGWTLTRATITSTLSQLQMTSSILIANLAWAQNQSADSARRALASTVQTPPGGSFTPATAALAPADGAAPQAQVQSFGPGGQNVVFQHGIFSSGATWNRMRGWLEPLFEFGRETVPSLPSTARLADQGTDLVNLVSGAQNDSVLIGHSQGGLISRDVAQRRPDLVDGVLTIDTPHQGALIDLTGRAAAAGGLAKGILSLASLAGCTSPDDNAACALAQFLAVVSFPMVNFALDTAIPATIDLEPFGLSPYLNALNSHAESFVRVGIEGHSDKRWLLERLGGDSIANPDDTFGGRNVARATAAIFAGFITCAVIATLFGDFDIAAICLGIALIMKAIDVFWNLITAGPTDSSDGIVQGSSQRYPNATASYVISGADSHVGATRSDKTRDRVIDALDREFFVPRAGCQFLLSPASATVSGAGASGSVAVNTAINTPSNCAWTAVSDVPWITVPAGTHAVGSGSVPFTVAANPSPTSGRTGNVNISGLAFTVTQTAAPDFQLSVTPSARTIRAGESTTFTVSGAALNGFSGTVSLGAAVSPGGPGVSLAPASITVNGGGSSQATVTMTTTTGTAVGSYAVTVTGTGAGLTHGAAVALNVNPPPSPASGAISIFWGQPPCSPDSTCATGTVQVQMGGSILGNTCYVSGNLYTSVPIDVTGISGVADARGLANAIAGAFNGQGVTTSVSVSADGSSATVSFLTTATGTSQNLPVMTAVSDGVSGITVTPPNALYGCGGGLEVGRLAGGA